jgi:hypothetical protein
VVAVLVRRVVALLCAVFAAGCALDREGPVEPISADEVPYGLNDPLATTTTAATTTLISPPSSSSPPTTAIPTQPVNVYFISGRQLTYVTFYLAIPTTLQQIMERLQEGIPDGEVGLGLRSAVPRNANILVVDDGTGVARIDLPAGFFEGIDQADQRFAIAQIVLTMRREGIGQVSFTQTGEPTRVPRGNNQLAEAGALLTFRDYQNLLNPAPPETTTPTSTTPPPASTLPSTTSTTPSTSTG